MAEDDEHVIVQHESSIETQYDQVEKWVTAKVFEDERLLESNNSMEASISYDENNVNLEVLFLYIIKTMLLYFFRLTMITTW